jgi:hypothetical protein
MSMIPDEVPQAAGEVFGHNSGATLLQRARIEQEAALETFAQRKSQFLSSASKQTVRDRQSAADAADTIKLAVAVRKLIDEDRAKRTDPYREVHTNLIGMVDEFWSPVEDSMLNLFNQIEAWNADEDKRIADQKAEQEAEMARMRGGSGRYVVADEVAAYPVPTNGGRSYLDYTAVQSAPVKPAAPGPIVGRPARTAKIRGDLGGVISRDQVKVYEIEDIKALPAWIFETETVKEAILNVARSNAKHMPNIPGIKTSTALKTNVK